jgi:hypothetical protein
MMIDASTMFEVFLATLLIACLVYCWRVERSLAQFRASRAELEKSARDLVMAVSKAEGAIKGLRQASHETGEQLQERIIEARALADELAVMGGTRSARPPQSRSAPETPMWNR